MKHSTRRTGLIAAGIALIAAAACSKNGTDREQAGVNGLELAPKAGRQVVVSPIEGGGGTAATSARHTTRSVRRSPAQHVAVGRHAAAPARTRGVERASNPPGPQPEAHAPPQQRQPGVYSTEADIFRRMPWIRP